MLLLSVHKRLIALLCLGLLAGCFRQSAPEEPETRPTEQPVSQVELQGINTLILSYQTPEQRQALQELLSSLALDAKLKRSAGGQAEFELSLDEAGFYQLQEALKARYRIERRGQRLYLVCCL